MSIGKYLKSVFLNKWNLLGLFGATGFAVLSGKPEVVLPLVAAAEIAFVGLLGTHPRYQSFVDAQEAKAHRAGGTQSAEVALNQIVGRLPRASLERFESLRQRCLELRGLAMSMKDPGHGASPPPLDSLQLQGLDRLLWIFLRLLHTQHSLHQFLEKTGAMELKKEIERLESRLKPIPADTQDTQQQKVRKALEDNLETCKARLENLQKARDNCELVGLEIDRLENKIRSLSEIAVNRHEPDFITGQVDQVATSMLSTEKTMNELQFATGIDVADEQVPELLRRPALRATQ